MTTCGSLSPVPWGISRTILWLRTRRPRQCREALLARRTDTEEDVREEATVGLGKRCDLWLLPVLRALLAPELNLRVAEAASAMLGLGEDPVKWEAEDYKRALDETFGPSSA
jgi:hypothetical protein